MYTWRTYTSIWVLMILLFLLIGCSHPPSSTFPAVSTNGLPLTSSQTVTYSGTQTSTLVLENTVVPTVPDNIANSLLQQYLENNGGCELPCFWGITPGLSELQDARDILAPLRGIASRDTIFSSDLNEGSINFEYVQDDNSRLLLDLRFIPYPGEATIEVISVNARVLRTEDGISVEEFDSPALNQLLSKYTLQTILQVYGVPERISVYAETYKFEWNAPTYVYIYLLYPESGIFAEYRSPLAVGDDKAYCYLTESFGHIWLISPDEMSSYERVLTSINSSWVSYFSNPDDYKSVEDTFDMTEEVFIRTIIQTPTYQFETPLSIWPP